MNNENIVTKDVALEKVRAQKVAADMRAAADEKRFREADGAWKLADAEYLVLTRKLRRPEWHAVNSAEGAIVAWVNNTTGERVTWSEYKRSTSKVEAAWNTRGELQNVWQKSAAEAYGAERTLKAMIYDLERQRCEAEARAAALAAETPRQRAIREARELLRREGVTQ